jgi:hypothetical protein
MNSLLNDLNLDAFKKSFKEDLDIIIAEIKALPLPAAGVTKIDFADFIYKKLYKRVYLNYNSTNPKFNERFLWSKKEFRLKEEINNNNWNLEILNLSKKGDIAVSRGDYDIKRVYPGTYLKTSLIPNQLSEKDQIIVRWPINGIKERDLYFHFYGKTIPDEFSNGERHLRFYFHLKCQKDSDKDKIEKLVKSLIAGLDTRLIPFDFKINIDGKKFYTDSAVLYIERRYFQLVVDFLIETCEDQEYREIFNEEVGMFTYRLTNGLSFCECQKQVSDEEVSFGQQRSKIIADIIQNKPSVTSEEIFTQIDSLSENKNWHNKFFLNDDSNFKYTFLNRTENNNTLYQNLGNTHLKLASSIGYKICKESIWIGDCCTWIGLDGKQYTNLIENYLDGLSGTMIFMTHLYKESGQGIFKQHAIGTFNTIFSLINRDNYTFSHGFHKGSAGVIWSLYEVNSLLNLNDIKSLLEGYLKRYLTWLKSEKSNTDECGNYCGMAGTLFGLSSLTKFGINQDLLAPVCITLKDLKDRILALQSNGIEITQGNEIHKVFLWKTTCFPQDKIKQEYLLGFGYGGSGIVLSLLYYSRIFSDEIDNNVFKNALKSEDDLRIINIKESFFPDYTENDNYDVKSSSFATGVNGCIFSRLVINSIDKSFIIDTNKINDLLINHKNHNVLVDDVESGYFDLLTQISKLNNTLFYYYHSSLKEVNANVLSGKFYPKNRAKTVHFHPGLLGLAGVGYSYLRLMEKSTLSSYFYPMIQLEKIPLLKKSWLFAKKMVKGSLNIP